jgi:hypothetical protein
LVKLVGHVVGVFAHLRHRLGEPAIYSAVHQQVAEGEHEHEGDNRNQHGPPDHARAQTDAENAAALVCIEFENVADEQDKDANEKQERKHRQRDKN